MTTYDEMAADCLDAAHDILMVDGWTQGTIRNNLGERCAMGALFKAAVENHEWMLASVHIDAGNALAQVVGCGIWPNIPRWNDDPERTLDEVLDAFRHAAKNVRNR